MIKKLICWIWGHKNVSKAFTGEQMEHTNMLGQRYSASLYNWEKNKFCPRCGEQLIGAGE